MLLRTTTTLLIFLQAANLFGDIIDSSRRIDWTGNIGVPGGIPVYSTIYSNMTGLDDTGHTDVSAAVQNALNNCPAGQVVKLPAGSFLVTNMISLTTAVVLRGAGTNTILLWAKPVTSSTSCLRIGTALGGDTKWSLATNANKGDSNVLLQTISGLSVSNVLAIEQTNDTSLVKNFSLDGSSPAQDLWYSTNCSMAQLVEVTAISGSNVTFRPPLNYNWTTNFGAQLHRKGSGNFTYGAGVEDLKVQQVLTNTGQQNFSIYFAKYSWIKNVESANCYKYHCILQSGFRCEVRDSYFHDSQGADSGGNYGISLALASAFNLVENNIIRNCISSMLLTEMSQGNVYGYNYSQRVQYSPTNWLQADISSHDAHPMMNLVEGNVAHMLIADLSHGSSSHNTAFRNRLFAWQPYTDGGTNGTTAQNRGVDLDTYNTSWNIVGNVLGVTNVTFQLLTNGPNVMSSGTNVMFMFGYSGSVPFTYVDSNVYPSTVLLGNYCLNSPTNGVPSDQYVNPATIPSSLYLTSKPAWWTEGLAWPAFGPDSINGNIPAQQRYEGTAASVARGHQIGNGRLGNWRQ